MLDYKAEGAWYTQQYSAITDYPNTNTLDNSQFLQSKWETILCNNQLRAGELEDMFNVGPGKHLTDLLDFSDPAFSAPVIIISMCHDTRDWTGHLFHSAHHTSIYDRLTHTCQDLLNPLRPLGPS